MSPPRRLTVSMKRKSVNIRMMKLRMKKFATSKSVRNDEEGGSANVVNIFEDHSYVQYAPINNIEEIPRVSTMDCEDDSIKQLSDNTGHFSDETALLLSTIVPNNVVLQSDDVCDSTAIVTPTTSITGRRIVDIEFFLQGILSIGVHEPFSCNVSDMDIISEKKIGLCSVFTFKCRMCNITSDIATEDVLNSDILNVNDASVLSCISTGIGHSQLVEQHAAINLPSLTFFKYAQSHRNISEIIRKAAWKSMEEAGKEEKHCAMVEGRVNKNGIPIIDVIVDGAWCKRSYKVNYNALSGVACIIGQRTGKLLYLGIKNKYCTTCARAEAQAVTVPSHLCFRNWYGTSTSMESEIICEGFNNSLQLHGVIYKRLIGDGDSSVMKKLIEAKPYGNERVEKIECRNHMIRNFIKKLKELSAKRISSINKNVSPALRHCLRQNIKRFRTAITKSIQKRKNEEHPMEQCAENLKNDLLNATSHIFGEHKKCAEIGYFCQKTQSDADNKIPQLRLCGLYNDIMFCIYRLVNNVFSLILDMDNNAAELYNAIVCKYVGGKRVNFALRGGYQTRCEAAAVSYNSKGGYYNTIYETATPCSSGQHTRKYVNIQIAKRKRYCEKVSLSPRDKLSKTFSPTTGADHDYGGNQDLNEYEYQVKETIFLESINKSVDERSDLEIATRGQHSNPVWKQERSIRLTSSMFGKVCKLRPQTSSANTVKQLVYSEFSGNRATRYGQTHEKMAVKQFEEITGNKVHECGLFLHPQFHYLGASPDGLIGDDCIVEIKCPLSCEKISVTEAINNNNIKYAKIVNGELILKENDSYMYQVQGQLEITQRKYCYFIVWSHLEMKFQKIERNADFWHRCMKKQLVNFYTKCILPELVDPRHTRKMEIRNPKRDFI